jgi:hypothetical protein
MLVLVATSTAWSLLMIIPDTPECSFFKKSLRLHQFLRSLPRKHKMNLNAKSRKSGVIMGKSLTTPIYMNIVMKLGSSMKILQHIHLNKMEL